MQKVYTKKFLIIFSVLCFYGSATLNAQITCGNNPGGCGSIAQNFNNGSGDFPSFVYPTSPSTFSHSPSTGDFRSTATTDSTFYVLNTKRFVLNSSGPLTVGYDLSKSTINPNGIARVFITVFYEHPNDPNQIGKVETGFIGFCDQVCTQLTDPIFQPGLNVVFRLTVETADNAAGVGNIIVADNFSNGAAAAPLPVNMKSFNAKRNNNSVILNWETTSEANVKGFEIQRKTSNGEFQKVAFVASKSVNGTSNSTLQYSFNDMNSNSDASEYRIVTIDLDGRTKISPIRSVEGLKGQAKILMYPNPSIGGPVNVVFPDSDARDIQLTDLVGRVHASWRSYKMQDLVVSKLTPGTYLLRVTNVKSRKSDILRLSVAK